MGYTTGLPSLDAALGGLEGLVEISGPESSGKTTLAYHILRRGGLYIGTEAWYDPTLAPGLVDEDRLAVLRPRFGEAAFEAAYDYLPGRVVIDSVSVLQPASCRHLRLHDDEQAGDRSRMLAYGARMLAKACREKGGLVVFIHQIRQNIGKKFSGPTRVPYGRGSKVFGSISMKTRRGAPLRRGYKEVGLSISIEVTKNVFRSPGSKISLDLSYGEGFRRSASLLDWAIGLGVIEKTGSWYRFEDEMIGQGRDKACLTIEERALWRRILEKASHAARSSRLQ